MMKYSISTTMIDVTIKNAAAPPSERVRSGKPTRSWRIRRRISAGDPGAPAAAAVGERSRLLPPVRRGCAGVAGIGAATCGWRGVERPSPPVRDGADAAVGAGAAAGAAAGGATGGAVGSPADVAAGGGTPTLACGALGCSV